tara:strand:- start:74 stop:625 length:552 start_codon:yes stop_codon:yes gene_type:complete
MHDIIPISEFNSVLLKVDTYTKIKNRMTTAKGTQYSTKKFQRSLQYWVEQEYIRKSGTFKNPKYHASLSNVEPISEFFDSIIVKSLSKLNENYDELKSKKLFGKDQSHLIFVRIDEIISSIELAQWSYFATKNRNNEKENLDKTITKGRKGIIKFCNKILVGKTNKEISLITDLCKKYPFPVF